LSTLIQRSMASGEISPALYQRTDLQKAASSLRTAKNGFIRKGGGFTNRAGTSLVYGPTALQNTFEGGPYEDAGAPIASNAIFAKWEASNSADAYVLEFGNGFLRFTKNGALVTVDTVNDWSSATSYVIGDLANYQGANYYCISAHSNQQPPNATYWYALSGYEYSIPTPYTTGLLERGLFSFNQDSDRMLITHGSLLPRELVRTSDTRWTLTAWPVDSSSPTRYGLPSINAPTSLTGTGGNGALASQSYVVTAVTTDLEESLPSNEDVEAGPDSANPVSLSWTASTFVTGATGTIKGYNIYKKYAGLYYKIAFSSSTSFDDSGISASTADDSPPESRVELNTTAGTSGGFPKKCGTFEGRTVLGNFPFNVQAGYGSRVGFRQNFTRRFPSADDDSILFQTKGKSLSGINHFVDIGSLIVFADSGEFVVEGNQNGTLTPSTTIARQYGYNGATSNVRPVVVGAEAVYVQERGSILRALGFDSLAGGKGGFKDADLTAFAEHLFEGKTIVAIDYQKTPHSIVWAVRSDGVLLGLTYIKEQEILAWHRHVTDGSFEDVVCIPEGNEHAVYLKVKRTINGSVVRYLERMNNRNFTDIVDAVFLDSALTFDGRNTDSAHTMTLSGGVDWDEDEDLTLTSSAIIFGDLEIGNEIWLTGSDEVVYRLEITACTNDKIVTVRANRTIAVASGLRGAATSSWSRAVDTISNLDHLEDKEVGVFADGYVVASPNNEEYGDPLVVTDGAITLPECHAVIHVGLPYLSDIETLDIDSSGGQTIVDRNKLIKAVSMHVQDTRGLFVGPKAPTDDADDPLENLLELKIREEEGYDDPVALATKVVKVPINGEWNSNGRVFIRQVDPLPMTILSIAPAGTIPFGGG
jgi:hypothetical protein